jgi:Carboxypeptidase regulatory-like domain/TonB dependent receptor
MRPSRPLGWWLLVALCSLVFLPSAVAAQTGAAQFTGIITDHSGAPMPGVTVTATNQGTQVAYTNTSNNAGAYTIQALPIGTYVVKTDISGFAPKTTQPIALESGQIARLDFQLDVTGVTESVEVAAQAPVLQTESATVGEVISGTTVVGLPLNGRNSGQFALLLAGVTTPNPGSFTAPSRAFSGGRPYVNGQREQTNNYTLDGVDMNESIDNLVAYQPSPDALAEISVQTNNYTAELGNVSGAIINNVIKSGTNDLHGNVFEFLRNSSMDANTWVNNRSHAVKPARKQNIYGGTIGGPIIQNKVFFFADYQGLNLTEPSTATGNVLSVPLAAWRTGDLSSLLAKNVIIKDPTTGQPFPGNIIPSNRISPVAKAILADTAAWPLPTIAGNDVVNDFVAGKTQRQTKNHQVDGKVDYNLSNSDRFFVRYSYDWYKAQDNSTAFPLIMGGLNDGPFNSVAVNWNKIISPTLVNELLFGLNSVEFNSTIVDSAGIGSANGKYGIAGDQAVPGLSNLIFTGSGLTSLGSVGAISDSKDKTYQINEKLSWMTGRHTVKFGGSWLHYNQNRTYAGNNGALGLFEYTGAFSGFAFSDFLLDDVARKGRGSLAPAWTHLQDRIGFFAQDDFKIRNDLTLNLGFRWEYTSPLVEKNDRQANFDLTTGVEEFANQNGNSRALYDPYYKGFEPRIGLAWTANDKLVVRSAYGIVQHQEGTGANLRLPLNPPFFYESEVRYDASTGPGSTASGFTGLQPLDQASGQVRAFDPALRPQFNEQWNVFFEYLVSASTSVNVGYVGNHSTHLATARDGNQPLPGTGDPSTWLPSQQRRLLYATAPLLTSISETSSIGHSNYNALQLSARHRLHQGIEFLGTYAFGKVMADSLGYYGSSGVAGPSAYAQNAFDQRNEYGPAFFDVKHSLSLSGTYELPIGKGLKYGGNWGELQDALLGGWSVSGIFQYHTGYPITVTDGRKPSLQASRGSERPNRIGDGSVSDPTLDHWLDIAAFQAAPAGTFGNSGVGILRAPNYANLDFVGSKRFNLGSQFITFKFEAFNVLNHPNFGPPARDISDAVNFGRVTSTVGNPRTLELVFKYNF